MIGILVPLWGSPITQEVIIYSMKAGVSHKVRGGSLNGKEEGQYSSRVLAVLFEKVAVVLALEIAMGGMEPGL